jgi:hypothetical protein
VQSDALGSFPYFVVLGFGMVWITFATLGFIWVATWRSNRRDAGADTVEVDAPASRYVTRARALRLVGVGLLGGAVVGGVASAYFVAQSGRPRGGGTTQP